MLMVGTLGEENDLEGVQKDNLYKIEFVCPYQCGESGMNIEEI